MSLIYFTGQHTIQVGKPMPCSVYGADRKLLLAKGALVASERLRDVIAHQAFYIVAPKDDTGAAELSADLAEPPGPPPTAAAEVVVSAPNTVESAAVMDFALPTKKVDSFIEFRKAYSRYEDRSRLMLRLARDEGSESYQTLVMGVLYDRRSLIVTAPLSKTNTLVRVTRDEMWLCRLFNATTVFRFMGKIQKVVTDPTNYLHIELPKSVERRVVRKKPRALTSLGVTLNSINGPQGVIVDLSATGLRLAVKSDVLLAKDEVFTMLVDIPALDRLFNLQVKAKVTSAAGVADARFPDVQFYGAEFEAMDDTAALVLHGYVQEHLAAEFDRLSNVLSTD